MTRTEIAVVALIVLVVAWLLMPPPVAPEGAPADMTPTPAAVLFLPVVSRDASFRVVVCKGDDREPCEDGPVALVTATPTPRR